MPTDDLECCVDDTGLEYDYTEADALWDAIFESEEGQLTLGK